jgi:hypothetical protein
MMFGSDLFLEEDTKRMNDNVPLQPVRRSKHFGGGERRGKAQARGERAEGRDNHNSSTSKCCEQCTLKTAKN